MIQDSTIKARIHKIARVVVTCVMATLAFFCRASADNEPGGSQAASGLKVYLPREVTVEDSSLSLGRIAVIQGQESLVAKASQIALGRISVPGQNIVIDRPTILSRLACNGIPASMVTLTGADQIAVKQQHQIVSGEEFVSLAESFLQSHRPRPSNSQWCATRQPEDFLVPGTGKNVRFSPRLLENGTANQASVELGIFAGEQKIGSREVAFGLKYEFRQAVTKVDIPAGGAISPENVEIQKKLSDSPQAADWKTPYGLIARRRLPANTVLRLSMLEPVESPTVVERNHSVVIRIERPSFVITAVGKAMQNGKIGEYIKVRNVDSLRIIVARINADGSVEPVL
jgi:flagellar basal body P-ring formation protein FlgA